MLRRPDLCNKILNKYLTAPGNKPAKVSKNPPAPIPQENCWYPLNLVEICSFILNSESKPMNKPKFTFDTSKSAANHNWSVLKEFNLDLKQALSAKNPSQLSYGSEFKDAKLLALIFGNHPLWRRLEKHLVHGCSYL